jgi:cellobiose phosphorylase
LDPPFDKSALNPGYIKGYVPGVRENGGQYTHGALWATMAFAALGDRERAWELFRMINPVNHAQSPGDINRYKVEPYVVAADVYAVPPHTGRGGWTWYTGSAGWMYRLIVESLLGLRAGRQPVAVRSLPSSGLEDLQGTLPIQGDPVSHHGAAIRYGQAGDVGHGRWYSAGRPCDSTCG